MRVLESYKPSSRKINDLPLSPSDRVFLFIEKSVNNFYLKSFQSSHCFLVQLRIEAGAELVVHDDLCLRIPGLEVADVWSAHTYWRPGHPPR